MHLIAIEEKVVFYLLSYGFNIKRKHIKENILERKERSIRSINPLKLIKRVDRAKHARKAKHESKFPLRLWRYFCVLFAPMHEAKQ